MAKQNTGVIFTAGAQAIWYGVRDANGYLTGNTATAPIAGATGSPLFRIPGLVDANIAIPEGTVVNVPGDNENLTTFTFPADTFPTGNISTASQDAVFEAIIKGTKVYTDGTRITSIVEGNVNNYTPIFLHILRNAQTGDPTNYGNKRWQNIFMPNVTVQALNAPVATRTHSPFSYKVDARRTNNTGTGETFTTATYGATLVSRYDITTLYPYTHMVYTGDNATTVFNLEYTPISTAEIKVFVNGVLATVSSVDTTLKTFTLSSAPATSAIVIAFYGFPESELSL